MWVWSGVAVTPVDVGVGSECGCGCRCGCGYGWCIMSREMWVTAEMIRGADSGGDSMINYQGKWVWHLWMWV